MPTTTLSADYRVTLPQGLCKTLLISPGSLVEISIHDGALRIIPAATAAPSLAPRPCGLCKGEFTVPDDFNEIDLTGNPHESRSVARELLRYKMEEYSPDGFRASWLMDLEFVSGTKP